MTDRELLEAAARAAGIELIDYCTKVVICYYNKQTKAPWNPLTDDGDALRLAVKLKMDVLVTDRDVWAMADLDDEAGAAENVGTDPNAATRRAIVRAAAVMKEGGGDEQRTSETSEQRQQQGRHVVRDSSDGPRDKRATKDDQRTALR